MLMNDELDAVKERLKALIDRGAVKSIRFGGMASYGHQPMTPQYAITISTAHIQKLEADAAVPVALSGLGVSYRIVES
jgi:hypothetical protein